jgi:glycosyltransferase involved in cell wall biosynthesis
VSSYPDPADLDPADLDPADLDPAGLDPAGVAERLRRAQDALEQQRVELLRTRTELQRADAARHQAQKDARRLDAGMRALKAGGTYRTGLLVRAVLRPAEGLGLVRRRLRERASRQLPRRFRQLDPNPALADAYRRAAQTASFTTDRTRTTFLVSTVDINSGAPDLYAAVGLGRHLSAHGYEVAYLPPGRGLPGGDVVVALDPSIDVTTLPDGCRVVAWARDRVDDWADHPQLALFDLVLAPSPIARDRLARRYDGPIQLLAVGVDTDLFQLPAMVARRAGALTESGTRHQDPWHQTLVDALSDVDSAGLSSAGTLPLIIAGDAKAVDTRLSRYAVGAIDHFRRPDGYRRCLIAFDRPDAAARRDGRVSPWVLESLACGALPLVDSRAGLAELGLAELPAYHDARTLAAQSAAALANPARTEDLAGRLGARVRADHAYSRRAEELHSGLAPVLAGPPRRVSRRVLGVYPPDPGYAATVRASLAAAGVLGAPVPDAVADPAPHRRHGSLTGYLLHIRDSDAILRGCATAGAATQRLANLTAGLDGLRERGGSLLWTVPSTGPDEQPYPDLARDLGHLLADRADVVHTPHAEAVAVSGYRVPGDKVRVVGNGYLGRHPEAVSRTAARARLGLTADEIVLLYAGAGVASRGLPLLLDAFEVAAAAQPRLRLLVAGPVEPTGTDTSTVDDVLARCRSHSQVVTNVDPVPDAEIQVWYKAADAVVLPHPSLLYSGAVEAAIAFGRPVIGPRPGPAFARPAVLDPAYTAEFRAGDVASLRDALLATAALGGRRVELAARRAAAGYRAEDMARDYTRVVTELLDQDGGPRADLTPVPAAAETSG